MTGSGTGSRTGEAENEAYELLMYYVSAVFLPRSGSGYCKSIVFLFT